MEKILNPDFRKELYKSLMEAGYTKNESQQIVGTKYFNALHTDVIQQLNSFSKDVTEENFDTSLDYDAIKEKLDELKKLKELLKN